MSERDLSNQEMPSGLRDMTQDEIETVFETFQLPLAAPKPTPQEQKMIFLFPVSGSSAPSEEPSAARGA